MEDVSNENNSKKRVRDHSEQNSPESERVDSDASGLNSPEAKRIRKDLLDILDDSDAVADRDPAIQDLDSFIRSFEEEILHNHPPSQPAVVHPASDSGESQPELGYLLEASDDELGLPPTFSPSDEQPKNESISLRPEFVGLGEIMGFEDEMPSYDSFEFGMVEETRYSNEMNNEEFVTLGGLFDDSEASDFSEYSWRSESLHAL